MSAVVRTVGDFAAPGLCETWAALSAASRRTQIFSTFEWCQTWAHTVGHASTPAILLIERSGRTIGLLPACQTRRHGATWLELMGRERVSGDHLDIVCAPEDHAACAAAVCEFLAAGANVDGLIFGELELDSPLRLGIRAWAQSAGLPLLEREPRRVPYIDLPATFDEYVARLSANMRYHVRRRRREAERAGAACRVLTTIAEIEQGLTALFALHAQRWESRGQRGNFGHPLKREFLQRFCRAADGAARCYVLELGGVPQAALLAFHYRETASFYQMGWDPAGPLHSPGVVVIAASIARAIAEGLTRYDLLRGDEAYKQNWTSTAVDQVTVVVARRRAARALLAAEALKNGLRGVMIGALGPATWSRLRRVVTGRTH